MRGVSYVWVMGVLLGCRSGEITLSDVPKGDVEVSSTDTADAPIPMDTGTPADTGEAPGLDTGSSSGTDTGLPLTIDTGGVDTGEPAPELELCDGEDNDGDGLVDEDFPDTDGDGIADCVDIEECDGLDNDGDGEVDEGFETDSDADGLLDCLDAEDCDGLDNDGDGLVDEDFTDTDRDGTADCLDVEECDGLDNDGDGEVDEGFDADGDEVPDCFDVEICDGLDNDGDGLIDESGAYGEYTWYIDEDGDGVGRESGSVDACDAPEGMVATSGDCDDDNPDATPGATEVCDGIDNDCDTHTDEGFDSDADDLADCFDTEECDGLDNDGDGEVDEGFADTDVDGIVDCLDFEECDGLDNDGDGLIDEGFDFTGDGSADCTDDDGDGLSEADGDCDDSRDFVYPGAPEIDDGIDNDCDGEDLISVLFDLSHGEGVWSDPETYDTYTGWGYAADIIEDMGAIWGRLDDWPITEDALDGWDVLVIAEPTWGFSPEELDVLTDYVDAGGGLLLTTDYNVAYMNPVASMFGARFSGTSIGSPMVTDLAAHPITEDVDSIYIANGSSLVIDDAEVVGRYGGYDIVAASELGDGGIVFVSDNEVFSYYAISFADNDTFLERIITWLARDG